MKFKPLLLALVAMTIGLVTAVSVGRKPGDTSSEPEAPVTRSILVAAVDIDAGVPMDSQNVRLDSRPTKDIPTTSFHSLPELHSRFALRRLKAGQPITAANTTTSSSTALETIPSGYRMCVIHTSMTPSFQAALAPGCRVDVLVYLPQSMTVPAPITRRVVTAARVHRYDLEDQAGDNDPLVPCTVALLVKQDEVQPLLLAAENGLLRLSLVGDPTDTDNRQDDYTYQQLVASMPVHGNPPLEIHDQSRQRPAPLPEPEVQIPVPVSEEKTAAMIEEAVSQAVSAAMLKAEEEYSVRTARLVAEIEAEAEAKKMHWTMDIFTPTGVTQYHWKTPASTPLVMMADTQPETISDLQTTWQKIETALRDDEQDFPRK
ncbi:MAG: Flp pilus assembly protein CpaB [Pirellulaceae bacterium]